MNIRLTMLVGLLLLSGCTVQPAKEVLEPNAESGYFADATKTPVVDSQPFELDSVNSLLLVTGPEIVGEVLGKVGYFDRIITLDDLRDIVVKNNLSDEIPAVDGRIAISRTARAYKKFLWLRWDIREEGDDDYLQLFLTDPTDFNDLFVTEKEIGLYGFEPNDPEGYYSMLNSLIDYIKENSAEL